METRRRTESEGTENAILVFLSLECCVERERRRKVGRSERKGRRVE